MGATINAPPTLPQIWQRLNASHLRHRITHQIIEEHSLTFPSSEEQMAAVVALQRRITLHHVGVPRVIYYRQTHSDGLCSQLGGNYEVVVYCEYRGDCLQGVTIEKGQRLYHSSCQCVHILSAVHYLKERYGYFGVSPAMVFLGTRKQNISKVWIHSRVEVSQPELPSNQSQMCESISKLLFFMKNHKICSCITNEQLMTASKIKQLNEFKDYVFSIHNVSPIGVLPRKKSNSESTPHYPKSPSFSSNYFTQRIQRLNSIQKYPTPNTVANHPQIAKPMKIQFTYTSQNRPQAEKKQDMEIKLQQINNTKVELPQEMQDEPKPHKQIIQNAGSERHQSLFSPLMSIKAPSQQVSRFHSPSSSPQSKEKQQNFTTREMELPLKEVEDKGTSTHLPTTSRSPKPIRDHPFHPIEEIPEVSTANEYKQTAKLQWKRKDKSVSLHSSGNKFEKYRDAIRNYEQKLRLKFANSMGSNPLTAKRKIDLVIRQAPSTPPQGDYKQTQSLYNNSEEEEKQTSIAQINTNKDIFSAFENGSAEDRPIMQERKDLLEQTNQNSNQEQLQNKRLREQREKVEMEKDLEREKALIDSEMQDLLKQNAIQNQYKSIRDKIKQKKQTFAQLKAQAAKILEDLDY